MAMTRAFRDLWLKRCTDGTYEKIRGELVSLDEPEYRCCLGAAHAVGKELGLITSDTYTENEDGEGYLTKADAAVLGIAKQDVFAEANDQNEVPEGQHYPNEVLELIKNHPVID